MHHTSKSSTHLSVVSFLVNLCLLVKWKPVLFRQFPPFGRDLFGPVSYPCDLLSLLLQLSSLVSHIIEVGRCWTLGAVGVLHFPLLATFCSLWTTWNKAFVYKCNATTPFKSKFGAYWILCPSAGQNNFTINNKQNCSMHSRDEKWLHLVMHKVNISFRCAMSTAKVALEEGGGGPSFWNHNPYGWQQQLGMSLGTTWWPCPDSKPPGWIVWNAVQDPNHP